MCMKKGCSSPGEFYPVICAYTPGVGESRVVVGLELCLVCKMHVKVPTDVLADPAPILAALKSESARVTFCRMKSAEGRQFQKHALASKGGPS